MENLSLLVLFERTGPVGLEPTTPGFLRLTYIGGRRHIRARPRAPYPNVSVPMFFLVFNSIKFLGMVYWIFLVIYCLGY
jgi:hypothetical protein